MTYEQLLSKLEGLNLRLYELEMHREVKGLCIGNNIVLNTLIDSSSERSCILAEEIGHYLTTVGSIIEDSCNSRKQERRARAYAYDMLIGLEGLVAAWRKGCRCPREAAEYLGVTEEFFYGAMDYYAQRYGVNTYYKGCKISFIPSFFVEDCQ